MSLRTQQKNNVHRLFAMHLQCICNCSHPKVSITNPEVARLCQRSALQAGPEPVHQGLWVRGDILYSCYYYCYYYTTCYYLVEFLIEDYLPMY